MKALILKDFYNLKTVVRSYLVVLAIFAVTFLPQSGPGMFMPMVGVYCSMMTISAFSFDDYSKWNRFALVMPISRRQVVRARFAVMLLVSLAGVAASAAVSVVGMLMLEGSLTEVLVLLPVTLALSMCLMGTMAPLIYKFGPERGRILLLLAVLVPAGFVGLVWLLDATFHFRFSDGVILTLFWCLPLVAGLWDWGMYVLSCRIFEKQEL